MQFLKSAIGSFLVASCIAASIGQAQNVGLYAIHEATFQHSGVIANPYTELSATATLTAPDGSNHIIPLFWNGSVEWKLRFSPDQLGTWTYSVQSINSGLNGGNGSFEVINSENRGGIQRMTNNPSHFQYQDGTPMWFMGDTNWALYYNSPASSVEHLNPITRRNYIDKRAEQGFNVIHSQVIFGSLNENVPSWTNSGGTTFNTNTRAFTGEALNPAFFQQLDLDVAYLNSQGITGGLVLAWAEIPNSSEFDYRSFPSDQARLRYAEYIAARYSAYNVYFVVSGEWQKLLSASAYDVLGQKLADTDPHDRLVTIHNWQETPSSFGQENWAGFGEYRQVYSRLHENLLNIRAAYPDKPAVASEYAYFLRDQSHNGHPDKPNSGTIDDIRHATWDIAMAGAYFVTGFGSTYYGGMRHPTPFNGDIRDVAWEAQVQHVMELFANVPWWNLKPADELISAATALGTPIARSAADVLANPTRPLHQSERTFWALADVGRTYVGYFRGIDGAISLDLGDALPTSLRLQLFNPRSGEFQDLDFTTVDGVIIIASPDSQDWVVVAEVVPEPASLVLLGAWGLLISGRRVRQ
jgi:hypothetical protein